MVGQGADDSRIPEETEQVHEVGLPFEVVLQAFESLHDFKNGRSWRIAGARLVGGWHQGEELLHITGDRRRLAAR